MSDVREDIASRNGVAAQNIGDQLSRLVFQPSEQVLEEAFGGRRIPPILHQDVEHDTLLIDGAPKVVLLAVDPQKHLILAANSEPPSSMGVSMSLHPTPIGKIPTETVRVARAAFFQRHRRNEAAR